MNSEVSIENIPTCALTFETQWFRGTRWRSWLRHCATSRNVAVSALGLTQHIREMSTRNISWGGV
jgi:hypothetical protein